MYNPLKVSLENIIPLTEARDHFSQIVAEVQKDKLYVLTKGGKPAVAIIDVKYLETMTGGEIKEEHIEQEIEKAPEKVGLPPMVEHSQPKPAPIPPEPEMPPKPPAAKIAMDNQNKPNEPAKPSIPPPPPPPPKPVEPPKAEPPKPTPLPPTPKPVAPPTTPSSGPLKTPPVETKIDVSMNDDSDAVEKAAQEDKKQISGGSEDEAGPAQYAGTADKADNKGEPEDMVID